VAFQDGCAILHHHDARARQRYTGHHLLDQRVDRAEVMGGLCGTGQAGDDKQTKAQCAHEFFR